MQTWFPFLFGIVIKKIDRVYLGLDLTAFVYKGSIFFPTLNVYISSSICSACEITVFHFISLTVFLILLSYITSVYGICWVVSFVFC